MAVPPEMDLLESQILAFERAWQNGPPPEIEDFLPKDCGSFTRRELLKELICLDLEFRGRFSKDKNSAIQPKRLAAYSQIHSEWGDAATWPLELIGEEYRARQLWGDRPNHERFLADFPLRRAEIQQLLKQIDAELIAEMREERSSPGPASPMATVYDGRPDPQAPLAYSDYKLQMLIGAGLMGRVYRAWQQSLDRAVAVKYLRKSFHHDRLAVERFLAEARTVAKLRHPHIVGIHGLGRTPQGGYFIVMDWIDGPDLAQVLKQKSVSLSDAVRWTLEACAALRKAHDLHIIHCDLKPGNLLLDAEGHIHITDFGLSRSVADESQPLDRIEGTAPFMAPEQVSGHWGSVGVRTDVYGLGAVLYTLLTGEPPHQGRTLPDVLSNVVSARPITPPHVFRPDVPASLNALCMRCLAKSPAERFSNLGEISDQIKLVEEELTAND